MGVSQFRFKLMALALLGLALFVGTARADDVVVFAAASLKTALDQVAGEWQARSGTFVHISYAGSSQLARQIEQGAPADVFISASSDWMDYLAKANLLKVGAREDLLGNALVLIAHDKQAVLTLGPKTDLAALLGDGRLAMAMVNSVPAGIYGKSALESLGLWQAVAPKVAQVDNVRAALRLVSSGEAPYGIVYASDAVADPGVFVVARFPDESHAPIVYPAAILAASHNPDAQMFFKALTSPVADGFFKAQGFKILSGSGDG